MRPGRRTRPRTRSTRPGSASGRDAARGSMELFIDFIISFLLPWFYRVDIILTAAHMIPTMKIRLEMKPWLSPRVCNCIL